MTVTNGWSPKVYLPALLQLGAGAGLIALGVVLGDDALRTLGYAALGTGLATIGVGYVAKPGDVVHLPAPPEQVNPAAGDVQAPAEVPGTS